MFLDRRERGDDNETGLKEGEGTEMSTTVLPFTKPIITISNLKKNIFYDNYKSSI